MNETQPKLSILALFDDLCRYTNAFLEDNYEEELIKILRIQKVHLKKIVLLEKEVGNLSEDLKKYLHEVQQKNTHINHLKSILKKELEKRKAAEEETATLRRQLFLIRDILKAEENSLADSMKDRLAFINNEANRLSTINEVDSKETSSVSEISYDKTDEDVLQTSVIENVGEPKNSDSNVSLDKNEYVPVVAEVACPEPVLRRDRWCVSESCVKIDPKICRTAGIEMRDLNRPSLSPIVDDSPMFACSRSKGRFSLNGKPSHKFVTKVLIKPELCSACDRRMRFYQNVFKCEDCRAVCHPTCQDKVPLPCIPCNKTPRSSKGTRFDISYYVSKSNPMIPPFLVDVLNEIEKKGLNEAGLYRVNAAQKETRDLCQKYIKGKCLSVVNVDVHVLCNVVKDFLRTLSEPLITFKLWEDFAEAAEKGDPGERNAKLSHLVEGLPQPNRDTLAILACHLQRIAEIPETKMTINSLAKILGPAIIGSCDLGPLHPMDVLAESKKQILILEKLLLVPSGFWLQFLQFQTSPKAPRSSTPSRTTPATKAKFLAKKRFFTTPELSQVKAPLSQNCPK